MTLDELRKTKVGKLAINAHLSLGALEAAQPKPNLGSEGEDRKLEKGPRGVAYRVSLIVVGSRYVDGWDNLGFSVKPLIDAIAASLGFKDDADPRLRWRVFQTAGRRGDRANRED